MGRNRITDKQRDIIIELHNAGFDAQKISDVVRVGKTSVLTILNTDRAFREKDGSLFDNGYYSLNNKTTMEWCRKRYGYSEEEFISSSKPIEEEKKNGEHHSCNLSDLEDAIHVSARLIAEQTTTAIHEMANALTKKMDALATIIQSCSANEIQKLNANSDNEFRELQKAVEHLGCIRSNTKRK